MVTWIKMKSNGYGSTHWKSWYWREGGVGDQEFKGHPWLHSKFKTIMGYMRPCFKNTNKKIKPDMYGRYGCQILIGCFPILSSPVSLMTISAWSP